MKFSIKGFFTEEIRPLDYSVLQNLIEIQILAKYILNILATYKFRTS